ncbi:hypothetical protein JZ751_011551, partial [Albula glossodonta]
MAEQWGDPFCFHFLPPFDSDPDGELGNPAEDGEEAGLKRKAVSQGETEGEVDGEEDEEAPHSCAGCRQVFESLNDLNEHKINQCQLTVGRRSIDPSLSSFLSDRGRANALRETAKPPPQTPPPILWSPLRDSRTTSPPALPSTVRGKDCKGSWEIPPA